MATPKVGVLGSGDAGRVLGAAFVKEGHDVVLGTRDATKPEVKSWAQANAPRGRAGSFEEAAAHGEILVLATLGKAVPDVIEAAGRANFAGKVLIDVTNPLEFKAPGKPPELFVSGTDSLGEQVQRALPDARVVKAFNIIGNPDMYKPSLPGGPPSMFFCGDDAQAKQEVAQVLRQFGHEPLDIGGIQAARFLEAMCIVWVLHGFQTNTWRHAFKLIRK
jgi:8-hydroxy-5-deazaflavin:NADPH oxidoreductase